MNEALISFTGIELIVEPEIDAISRRVAETYGLTYLVVGPSPGTTTTTAAANGIPQYWPRSASWASGPRPMSPTTPQGCVGHLLPPGSCGERSDRDGRPGLADAQ